MSVRRAVPAVVAALLLAGCATGTRTSADAPGPTPEAGAGTGTAQGRTPHGTLLVADFGGDTVTFVDPGPGRDAGPLGSVEAGTAPYGLTVGEDGRAWVATAEGVAVIDTATRTRLAVIPYATESGPVTTGEYRGGGMGIALAPDGAHVYVGVNVPGGNGVLEVIDTATRKVTATVPVGHAALRRRRLGRRPRGVRHRSRLVRRDGRRYPHPGAAAHGGRPVRHRGGLGSWLKPHYAVVRPSDGKLLLPFEGERLAVLDPRTGKVRTERMTADTHQHGAALTPDGTLLVVGTGPIAADDEEASLTVRTPDGGERTVALDGPHEDVAVSQDGRTAYVTGGFTRDGHWNGITVVDLAGEGAGKPFRIGAGERPLGIAVL